MTREPDLDLILSSWLADGAERAPERDVEAAIDRVAHTPQRRASPTWWPLTLGGRTAGALLVTLLLVIAAGIGVGIQTGMIRPPRTEPVPSPTAQDLVSRAGSMYGVAVPASWQEETTSEPDARRWSGSEPDGSLTVRYSGIEGQVTLCFEECQLFRTEGGIPYDAERALESLFYAVAAGMPHIATDGNDLTFETEALDGGPALRRSYSVEDRRWTFVVAIRDGRPIVLQWDEPAAADGSLVHDSLAGFHFVYDPRTTTWTAPGTLRIHEGDGYEIAIPDTWSDDVPQPRIRSDPAPGVRRFGYESDFPNNGLRALTVSVGTRDGEVVVCEPICEPLTGLRTLDDIELALQSYDPYASASGLPEGWEEQRESAVLGGEPARLEGAVTEGLYDPQIAAYRHVFAIHDGRPVILAFDYWTIAQERISEAAVTEIIESFRLTDGDPGAGNDPGG